MKDKFLYIIVGILFVLVILIWVSLAKSPKPNEDILLERIHKLELKIDSLNDKKDSLRIIIDSTHVKIINNEEHYKEVVNTILSQPDSITDLWTKQYINDYRNRLINGQ